MLVLNVTCKEGEGLVLNVGVAHVAQCWSSMLVLNVTCKEGEGLVLNVGPRCCSMLLNVACGGVPQCYHVCGGVAVWGCCSMLSCMW
jgi:hypothetical protein